MRLKEKYVILPTQLLLLLLLLLKIILLIQSKKTDHNTQISETENEISDLDHDEYITTQEFNRLTSGSFTVRLSQANLVSKKDIADFVKRTSLDEKLKTVALNKNKLNELSKKLK